MTSSHPTPAPCQWLSWLATALDRCSAPGLAMLFLVAILAVASELAAMGPAKPGGIGGAGPVAVGTLHDR
jgi:hypothetical protein